MSRRSARPVPRLATVLAAGTALAALAAVLVPAPALAAPPGYVALGDSYSSGTGTRTYLADGTACQRSVYAYPSLIARSKGYALNFRACAGATTYDVATYQLGALRTGTAYVSLPWAATTRASAGCSPSARDRPGSATAARRWTGPAAPSPTTCRTG